MKEYSVGEAVSNECPSYLISSGKAKGEGAGILMAYAYMRYWLETAPALTLSQ